MRVQHWRKDVAASPVTLCAFHGRWCARMIDPNAPLPLRVWRVASCRVHVTLVREVSKGRRWPSSPIGPTCRKGNARRAGGLGELRGQLDSECGSAGSGNQGRFRGRIPLTSQCRSNPHMPLSMGSGTPGVALSRHTQCAHVSRHAVGPELARSAEHLHHTPRYARSSAQM
jgi:hypothetical protein